MDDSQPGSSDPYRAPVNPPPPWPPFGDPAAGQDTFWQRPDTPTTGGAQPTPGYPHPAGSPTPGYGDGPVAAQAQPGYGDPTGRPPYYGAAVPGQPSPYGNAGQPPFYGDPAYGAPAPLNRSHRPRWLVPLLVLAILVGVGGTVGGIKLYHYFQDANTIYHLPDSVDGLPRATGSNTQIDAMKNYMHTILPSAKVTAGAYRDTSDPQRQVILMGIETPLQDPEAEVSGGFRGFAMTAPGLSDPQTYPAGAQGGAMECAAGDIGTVGVSLALCVVADTHGMIFLMYFTGTEEHTAQVTEAIRPDFERT